MYTYNLDIDENVEPTYICIDDNTTKNECDHECQQLFGTCVEKKLGKYCFQALKRNISKTNRQIKLSDSYTEYVHIYRTLVHYELDKIDKNVDICNESMPLCVREGSITCSLKWTKWRNTVIQSIVKTP